MPWDFPHQLVDRFVSSATRKTDKSMRPGEDGFRKKAESGIVLTRGWNS